MSVHACIYEDAQETVAHCAAKILEPLGTALAANSTATLAISGGSTPKLMFQEKKYSAQIVNGDGRDVLWYLDRSAARRME